MIYHVFFESDEGFGLHIGSYQDKDRAEKMGMYVWDLFENDGTDNTNEINETAKLWRKYEVFSDTEFTPMHMKGLQRTSGLSSILVFESDELNFVNKYIEYRGTTQVKQFT
jgi:hypothetical protein